jgi:hypothetical protein
MGIKISLKFVRAELDLVRETIREWQHFIPDAEVYGMTVPIQWRHRRCENRRLYLHFFFDPTKAIDDERSFAKQLCQLHHELSTGQYNPAHQKLYRKYFDIKTTPVKGEKITANDAAIAANRKNFGFFSLVGNDTMTAAAALTIYRNKDVAEKAFDNVKDRLDMHRLRVSSDLSLDGKLFVMFVSLIFISYIHKSMLQSRLYAKFTMTDLLDELEMIECFYREGHKPQLGEVTFKQLDLFHSLGVAPPRSSLC